MKKIHKLSRSFETDTKYLYKKSEQRAWIISYCSIVLVLISWTTIFLLMPLKEVVPYVIRVNNITGMPDIITGIDKKTLKADEAIDKYFLKYYIELRNNYTYQTIYDNYLKVQLFSSPSVANAYRSLFVGSDSVEKKLNFGTASTEVISIILDESNGTKIATVRFKVLTLTENSENEVYYLAKIAYDYFPQTKYSLTERIDNPLGFVVTSYQATPEAMQ